MSRIQNVRRKLARHNDALSQDVRLLANKHFRAAEVQESPGHTNLDPGNDRFSIGEQEFQVRPYSDYHTSDYRPYAGSISWQHGEARLVASTDSNDLTGATQVIACATDDANMTPHGSLQVRQGKDGLEVLETSGVFADNPQLASSVLPVLAQVQEHAAHSRLMTLEAQAAGQIARAERERERQEQEERSRRKVAAALDPISSLGGPTIAQPSSTDKTIER